MGPSSAAGAPATGTSSAGAALGVLIDGGDENRILGNLFGVDEFGAALSPITTPISIAPDTDLDEPATGNVVGAKLSPGAAASPRCDGGCNAITNGQEGISLQRSGESPRSTTITGNFIGLRPDGASALENEFEGIDVWSSDQTTIGGGRRERNYITGGRAAWSSSQLARPDREGKPNRLRLDRADADRPARRHGLRLRRRVVRAKRRRSAHRGGRQPLRPGPVDDGRCWSAARAPW